MTTDSDRQLAKYFSGVRRYFFNKPAERTDQQAVGGATETCTGCGKLWDIWRHYDDGTVSVDRKVLDEMNDHIFGRKCCGRLL